MSEAILSVRDLSIRRRLDGRWVRIVDKVSFDVRAGEILGVIGESGSGKTTLARAIVGLNAISAGEIRYDGVDVARRERAVGWKRDARIVRELQIVFQDPMSSLNPRQTAARIVEEPMIVHRVGEAAERRDRVNWLLEKVGLSPADGAKLPHEFSGGQRQRIGIARALALAPKLIICDEPVSALDVSVQAQVLNLLTGLAEEFGLTLVFISHDLSVLRHVADRIVVMHFGRIVESGDVGLLWDDARHPYTQALIAAAPESDRLAWRARSGEPPSLLAPPSGCSFQSRCPAAQERCAQTPPSLRIVGEERRAACHIV